MTYTRSISISDQTVNQIREIEPNFSKFVRESIAAELKRRASLPQQKPGGVPPIKSRGTQ